MFGLFTVVAGLMPSYASFAVMLVPTGAAALVFSVANNSFVQLGVDPQMRGRVMALYFMCFMGGTPVGAPLIGLISEHLGARWGLILGGAVCVVAGLAAAAVLARGRRVRLEARPRPTPPAAARGSAGHVGRLRPVARRGGGDGRADAGAAGARRLSGPVAAFRSTVSSFPSGVREATWSARFCRSLR